MPRALCHAIADLGWRPAEPRWRVRAATPSAQTKCEIRSKKTCGAPLQGCRRRNASCLRDYAGPGDTVQYNGAYLPSQCRGTTGAPDKETKADVKSLLTSEIQRKSWLAYFDQFGSISRAGDLHEAAPSRLYDRRVGSSDGE